MSFRGGVTTLPLVDHSRLVRAPQVLVHFLGWWSAVEKIARSPPFSRYYEENNAKISTWWTRGVVMAVWDGTRIWKRPRKLSKATILVEGGR